MDSSTENREDGGGRSGRSHVGDVADGSLETGGGVGAFPSFSTLAAWTATSELGEGSRGTQALGANSAGLSNRDFRASRLGLFSSAGGADGGPDGGAGAGAGAGAGGT